MICSVPNANSPFASRLRYKDFTHELSFTEETLKEIFYVSKFEPVFIRGERIIPFTVKGWVRYILSKFFRFFGEVL